MAQYWSSTRHLDPPGELENWRRQGRGSLVVSKAKLNMTSFAQKSEFSLLNGSLLPSTLFQRAQRQIGSFLGHYERRRISEGIRSLLKLLATLLLIGIAKDGNRGV